MGSAGSLGLALRLWAPLMRLVPFLFTFPVTKFDFFLHSIIFMAQFLGVKIGSFLGGSEVNADGKHSESSHDEHGSFRF